jgi:hypothetical protein
MQKLRSALFGATRFGALCLPRFKLLAQHPLLPLAKTGDAISIAANIAVPINLTMVTDQTACRLIVFNHTTACAPNRAHLRETELRAESCSGGCVKRRTETERRLAQTPLQRSV